MIFLKTKLATRVGYPEARVKECAMPGFVFVQYLRVFMPVLPFGDLLFIHASTNATEDHKYSQLPSADFDIAEVLV